MASRVFLTFLREQKLGVVLLRKLKIKMLAVQVVLNDAEAKQITNSAVKDWMDELKDALYEAEELLDDITTEALRCKMEYSDPQTQVRNIISVEGIESRVEEITYTLEFLAQQKDALGLKEGVGEKLSNRWPTTSLVDDSGALFTKSAESGTTRPNRNRPGCNRLGPNRIDIDTRYVCMH